MKSITAVFALLFGVQVAAMPLDPIEADGRLWLQPIDFLGLSHTEISAVCDPNCDGMLAGTDLTGWQWASTDDLNALFNFYIGAPEMGPGPDTYSELGLDLAFRFLDDGWMVTTDPSTFQGAVGLLADTSERLGFVGGGLGATTELFSGVSTEFSTRVYSSSSVGAWFSRTAVPVPAPALLMLFGLACLVFRR